MVQIQILMFLFRFTILKNKLIIKYVYVLLKTDEVHELIISGLLVLVKKNYCITIHTQWAKYGQIYTIQKRVYYKDTIYFINELLLAEDRSITT